MRTRFVIATVFALAAAPAVAAGVGSASICTGAGFRAGTAAFDMCVARFTGDDPLSALEPAEAEPVPVVGTGAADPAGDALEALDGERGKQGVAPVHPPARDGEFPATAGGGGLPGGGLPGGEPPPSTTPPPALPPSTGAPSAPPPGGGIVTAPTAPTAPTPPTPPQINTFTITMPAWNWGR